MNSKVLLVGSQETSVIHTSCLLAIELKKAGMEVRFGCLFKPNKRLTELLSANDIEYDILDINVKGPGDIRGKKKWAIKNRELFQIERKISILQEKQLLKKIEEYLNKQKPDLLFFEQIHSNWVLPFVKSRIPIIGMNVTLSNSFSVFYPPFFSWKKPGFKLFDIFINSYLWYRKVYSLRLNKYIWGKINEIISFGFKKAPDIDYHKQIKKLGFKIKSTEFGNKIIIPELVFCLEHFDFPNCPKKNRFYFGASLLFETEGKVDFILNKEKKLIYCTLGNNAMQLNPGIRNSIYNTIINLVNKRDDFQLVIQTQDPQVLNKYRDTINIVVRKWVPHLDLFPNTALVTCHAGLGTLKEAIYSGVPCIVLPWTLDQPGNAARVEYHNL